MSGSQVEDLRSIYHRRVSIEFKAGFNQPVQPAVLKDHARATLGALWFWRFLAPDAQLDTFAWALARLIGDPGKVDHARLGGRI